MPLQKQNISIPFASGIDQKTDSRQLAPEQFAALENAVYNKDKKVDKRAGFNTLTSLPANTEPTTLTTFDDTLTAIGNSLQTYVEASMDWVDRGRFQPIQLSTLPVQRNSKTQSSPDAAYSGTGLACVTYADSGGVWRYQINDSATGAVLVAPVEPAAGAVNLRATAITGYFLVSYTRVVAATPRIRFIAIPWANITNPSAEVEVSNLVASGTALHDTLSLGDVVLIAWASSDGGGGLRVSKIDAALNIFPPAIFSGNLADRIGLAADNSGAAPVFWVGYYTSSTTTRRVLALSEFLATVLAPTTVSASGTITNITIQANEGVCEYFSQVFNTYSFSATRSDFIQRHDITVGGSVTGPTAIARSVGLGSKAFTVGGNVFMLSALETAYQPSYYLIDDDGQVVARLAYSNGGGYETEGILSSVTVDGTAAGLAYLFKDLLLPVSKAQSPDAPGGVYTGTGVSLATFDVAKQNLSTAEIGGNLHIAGGLLWAFDGTTLTEQGFNYWPEDIEVNAVTSGGSMLSQTYYYQVTYEWTDAQGNIHRSAPSLPMEVVVPGGDSDNSVTLDIPTLRLTYKPDARIVIYRWSTAQQNYYQVTSITSPTLNDPAVDSILYTDTQADASIIGNPLIYTTGGVVENIPAPACDSLSLFQSRLVLISSENRNTVWYSKQVLQATPVEMSDLFTIYVAPSIGAQGSTGDTQVLYPLDEKLLFFKENAIYYMVGTGPDAAGGNNDFSEPSFITASVGSANQDSMTTIPQGVMFQSNKGIWLLGRELSTSYIGAPVEDGALGNSVTSAQNIPGTTQARFMLNNGTALVYDYYFNRWSAFTSIPSISSTVYQGAHVYLTAAGEIRQEQEDYYKDGVSQPVTLRVETPWYNLAGLQGFQRASQVYLLGTYRTPHTIRVSVYYDYEDGPSQVVDLTPQDFAGYWGDSEPFWGQDGVWGNGATLEQYRIFLNRQKMQAFKLVIQELYDGSYSVPPGAGLSLSGINVVVALKKGYVPLPASRSFG